MVRFKIPEVSNLSNCQFFQVPVACGVLAGYQYDAATRSLYAKESQVVIPSMHGFSHVAEDPVPNATCDTPGLMSADDKCKLDALITTRLGILGYQGAGFPDDGGFMMGDIILAAGSEFISIERIGNTVRFTVDSPIPLNCGLESCAQIFWIQDESEVNSVRAPTCNGKLPGTTIYDELKVYTLPENTIIDSRNPLATLQNKDKYPSFIFKRYANAITPYENEVAVILKRNANKTTNVGWHMTPGPNRVTQTVWYVGNDRTGRQMKFDLLPESEPGLLGSLLFQGHLLTKMPAVIVDYTPNVLMDNLYILRKWDINNSTCIGNRFNARNVWRYQNPENPVNNVSPKTLVLDSTKDLLPIGTVVDIYEFQINVVNGVRNVRSFFVKEPTTNPAHLWGMSDTIRFGDLLTARDEINNPISGTALTANEIDIADIRLLERTQFGLTNFEDKLLLSDDGGATVDSSGNVIYEPSGITINNDIVADIDYSIPGLKVYEQEKPLVGDANNDGVIDTEDLRVFACAYGSQTGDPNFNSDCDFNNDGKVDIRDLATIARHFDLSIDKVINRPLFLWHKQNHGNMYWKTQTGMPTEQGRLFPPYDFLLDAPIDSFDDTYFKVLRRGVITTGPFAGAPFIVIKGMRWRDMPAQGVIRILSGAFRNAIWRYYYKTSFANWDDNAIMLIGRDLVFPLDEDFPITDLAVDCTYTPGSSPVTDVPTNTTVVELLHQDYTAPAVRFQYDINYTTGLHTVQLQVIVGILDMSVAYPMAAIDEPRDDYVRGFAAGYMVSRIYLQDGFITDGIGTGVSSTPPEFRCYQGGELPAPVQGQTEKWNDIEILYKDGQLWLWMNGMMISPDPVLCSQLPSPVAVSTPYFPLQTLSTVGKCGLRLFPGAVIRSMEIRDQLKNYSEYTTAQLQIES